MARLPEAHMAGLSDTGLVRDNNEDALDWDEAGGIAVLADGMGGHRAGEVASAVAVATAMAALRAGAADEANVAAAVRAANDAVLERADTDPACAGMGTTLVAAALAPDRLIHAHVGDSRLYRWRDGTLERLTRDHNTAEALVAAGELSPAEAARSRYRHHLERAVGIEADVEVDVGASPLQPGDVYLLCSDGLTEAADDDLIAAQLAAAPDVAEAARALVRVAIRGGAPDNVTVLLIRVP